MHRLLLLSVLVAVASFPPSLQAQRKSSASAAFRVAPRAAAPPARMIPVPRGIPVGGVSLATPGRFGRPFFFNPRFRRRHFLTSGCFGNPFFCSASYYPYPLTSYPPLYWSQTEYVQQPYPVAPQTYDNIALRDPIDRLTEEVGRLRLELEARQAPQPSPRSAVEQAPPTILVFRDDRRMEVRNYSIVGQSLWVFSEQHARKYPLSALDLPATKSANERRGVEFTLPSH